MSTREIIRTYIGENFLFSTNGDVLNDEVSLLDSGLIDSMGIMELVLFVEEQFDIQVSDEDVVPENFDTVNGLVDYVNKKSDTLD